MRGTSATTTSLTAASILTSGDVTVNLLDTPGHPDFVGEVRAGLRAADAALFVVSAADGVDEPTRLLWRECEVVGMPRAVAVTRARAGAGRLRGDRRRVPAGLRRRRAAGPAAASTDGSVTGLLNLLRRTVTDHGRRAAERPGAHAPTRLELIDAQRGDLIESVIEESEDETLLERYLGGEEIDTERSSADLRTAIATARFFPIIPTHAPAGVGVEALLELFEKGFPSPVAAADPGASTRRRAATSAPVACDPDGPLVAEVVRTTTDPFVGRLSLVRVFSGTLHPDEPLHVSGHLRQFAEPPRRRATPTTTATTSGSVRCPRPSATTPGRSRRGHRRRPRARLQARGAPRPPTPCRGRTGRPSSSRGCCPNPLLPVAIHARSKGDEDKLAGALQRLVAEDVTMRLEHNAETHQLVLWAMGPAHVDQLHRGRSTQRYHVAGRGRAGPDLAAGDLRPAAPACRAGWSSSPAGTGSTRCATSRSSRWTAAPGSSSSTRWSAARCRGSSSRRWRRASAPSWRRACSPATRWSTSGSPSSTARRTRSTPPTWPSRPPPAMALREAANDSTVAMLEPVDAVDIEVADDAVGSVLADLRGRRGQVHGTEPAEAAGRTVDPRRGPGPRAVPLPGRPALGLARHRHLHPLLRPLRLPAAARSPGSWPPPPRGPQGPGVSSAPTLRSGARSDIACHGPDSPGSR